MDSSARRRFAALTVAGLSLAALTACTGTAAPGTSATSTATSSATGAGAPASGPHNDADVAFAGGMVPHHQQAVTMADLALARTTTPAITSLAATIKGEQAPEIATMTGWLAGWGAGTAGSTGTPMTGMMSQDEMSSLAAASGADFDRQWLELMVKHHQGAVTMSQTELSSGQNADAVALARSIIAGQSAEITTMTALLAGHPTAWAPWDSNPQPTD